MKRFLAILMTVILMSTIPVLAEDVPDDLNDDGELPEAEQTEIPGEDGEYNRKCK